MSKITFRADDELIERLDEFDASKSEVMRDALRAYLDERAASSGEDVSAGPTAEESLDDLVAERVDALIGERLGGTVPHGPQDVNVNITLEGESVAAGGRTDAARKTPGADANDSETPARNACNQCGENVSEDHVYCPNCGEKQARRVFCDCGDELRSDWGFCPSCGRRTPAADVLDNA